MKVLAADYEGRDCTSVVANKVRGNLLVVRSNNDLVGDPAYGRKKTLHITLEVDGKIIKKEVPEGELLVYPKITNDRLGIFYSNNHEPSIYPAIRASLASIKIAAEGKADIMTCMWRSEPTNPFQEYMAWTHSSSHLNQLLQIMQLLYTARECHEYKYVSFLEHDVLYPEGYFDYPEFDPGIMMTNMNYMGLNKKGYQSLGQRDEPFHQVTMRFDDAIKHCEAILPNALIKNAGMIEPQKLIRKQWQCIHPSIHINHGKHFTSHFRVYIEGKEFTYHDYWGDHSNYVHLL